MLIVFKKGASANNGRQHLFFVTMPCGLDALERLETSIPTSRTIVFLLCFPEKTPASYAGKITKLLI